MSDLMIVKSAREKYVGLRSVSGVHASHLRSRSIHAVYDGFAKSTRWWCTSTVVLLHCDDFVAPQVRLRKRGKVDHILARLHDVLLDLSRNGGGKLGVSNLSFGGGKFMCVQGSSSVYCSVRKHLSSKTRKKS